MFCAFFNVNYAQVRKSALTAINDAVGQDLDGWVQDCVNCKYDALMAEAHAHDEAEAQAAGWRAPYWR